MYEADAWNKVGVQDAIAGADFGTKLIKSVAHGVKDKLGPETQRMKAREIRAKVVEDLPSANIPNEKKLEIEERLQR